MCKLNVIPVEHQHVKIVIVSLVAFSLNSCICPASQLACPKTQSFINWDCLGLMGVFIQTCPGLSLWSQKSAVFSVFLLFSCCSCAVPLTALISDCRNCSAVSHRDCLQYQMHCSAFSFTCGGSVLFFNVSSLFNNQRFSF